MTSKNELLLPQQPKSADEPSAITHSDSGAPAVSLYDNTPLISPEDQEEYAVNSGLKIWISEENARMIEATIEYLPIGVDSSSADAGDTNTWSGRLPTPSERMILYLITAGLPNKEIATALGISDQTVKNHITSLLQKAKRDDRSDLVTLAVNSGTIEPLLINTEVDFSTYSELTSREREIFELLTGRESLSNAELGERLFITEQTVKNHMTSLLRKLNVFNRTEVVLYAIKRLELLLERQKEDIDLSRSEEVFLELLCVEPSLPSHNLPSYGVLGHTSPGLQALYKKLVVSNIAECVGLALFYEFEPRNKFASPEVQRDVEQLSESDKRFLMKFSSFDDSMSFTDRAVALGVEPDSLRLMIKDLIRDNNLPSVYQTLVLLQLNRFDEEKNDLQKRRIQLSKVSIRLENDTNDEKNDILLDTNDDDSFFDEESMW